MKVFNHIIIEITTNIIDFRFSYESNNIKFIFLTYSKIAIKPKHKQNESKSLTQKKKKKEDNYFFGKTFFVKQARR